MVNDVQRGGEDNDDGDGVRCWDPLAIIGAELSLSKQFQFFGNGCGAVGRAVASETRGPRFESSHRQSLLNICLLSTVL